MAYWLLKTEASVYSYADLEKAGKAVWDGVSNPVALKNLRTMTVGDGLIIYHTGDVKAAVGVGKVVSEPRADKGNDKLVVVDVKAERALKKPVTLAVMKGEKVFAESPLVRIGRLSVVPLTGEQWKKIMELGG